MKLPTIPRFSAEELIFSAKCFAASMLAFYLASWAGQPRPFWALMTTYVVAAPLAGMVRSKAVYRLAGTLLGSMAAVLLVPTFANSPELLSLTMSLWLAGCLYLSLQDRTPRAYVFMLAGYTAALIGFPAVSTPETMFDTAAARVEEIGLGILSATIVHSLIMPADLTHSVLGLLNRSLGDMRQWAGDILQRQPSPQTAEADRARVAADITQLRLLGTHIPYDTGHLSWTADSIAGMQDAIAALTPALSAAEDRLQALEEADGKLAPDIEALLVRIETWLARQEEVQCSAELPALRNAIQAITHADVSPWNRVLRIGLATRLDELVTRWQVCLQLRGDIDHGLRGAPPRPRPTQTQGQLLHLDQGMALLSASSALVATLLCCAFWILTGWSSGAMAAMMAGIFSSFFATMDDPVPAIHGFLKWTLWSIPISAVYVLVLLPLAQDFATLALICAPTLLFLGALAGRPASFTKAMPVIMGVCGTLAMHDTSQADLVSFLNSMLGQVLGIVVAARTARLMRSVGSVWSARRIQRATWDDLRELAELPNLPDNGEAYLLRMLDRIALLAPRVALAGGSVPGVSAQDALRDLRLGADIVTLQKHRRHLPKEALQTMLQELAGWYRQRIGNHSATPPQRLRTAIDALLGHSLLWRELDSHPAIAALVGLRRNIYPKDTPEFNPLKEGVAA